MDSRCQDASCHPLWWFVLPRCILWRKRKREQEREGEKLELMFHNHIHSPEYRKIFFSPSHSGMNSFPSNLRNGRFGGNFLSKPWFISPCWNGGQRSGSSGPRRLESFKWLWKVGFMKSLQLKSGNLYWLAAAEHQRTCPELEKQRFFTPNPAVRHTSRTALLWTRTHCPCVWGNQNSSGKDFSQTGCPCIAPEMPQLRFWLVNAGSFSKTALNLIKLRVRLAQAPRLTG